MGFSASLVKGLMAVATSKKSKYTHIVADLKPTST